MTLTLDEKIALGKILDFIEEVNNGKSKSND